MDRINFVKGKAPELFKMIKYSGNRVIINLIVLIHIHNSILTQINNLTIIILKILHGI